MDPQVTTKQNTTNEQLLQRWKPVLESENAKPINDPYRRAVTAQLLENQQAIINAGQAVEGGGNYGSLMEDSVPTNVTGNVAKYDPVLISLVRRAMPNLIAYDVAGVQPMTGPTGLIFAMRPKYVKNKQLGQDAFYKEADTAHSGTGTHSGAVPGVLETGHAMQTEVGEKLGAKGHPEWAEMGFEIEKLAVIAKTRALKAEYTVELQQDMKAVHGLDTEKELANILSSEILNEINREVIRTIYTTAKPGAQTGTTTAGTFDLDTDSNGRWLNEKFKGLLFNIERDANAIAKDTRRGKGNFIICSSDVASALSMAGVLDFTPALKTGLQVDDTGNTFAGVLNNRYKVYIDPWAEGDFYVVGYKGASSYDAGLFYTPYVPLQLYKTVDDATFQPKMGFKTRYGLVAAPFANGLEKGHGDLTADTNVYFRRVNVANIM